MKTQIYKNYQIRYFILSNLFIQPSKLMEQEFTIELTQSEADFLNTLLPKSNSIQLFQKTQKRRKAQKKLDDMYVSEFSLRPAKKIKKQPQNHQSKPQKPLNPSSKAQLQNSLPYAIEDNKNLPHIKERQKEIKKPKESIEKSQKNEIQMQKQAQVFQPHTSRSQRVSKPTIAYLQFQQETFKKKVAERTQPKQIPKIVQNRPELVQQLQSQAGKGRQQRKDEGEKMELQKQPSEQKQKQLIESNPQQRIIQSANLSTHLNHQPYQKLNSTPITAQTPKNHQNSYLQPSSVKSSSNYERNLHHVEPNFQHNNLEKYENLQNSQQQMPKPRSSQKQANDHQKKTSQLSEGKSSRNSHKFQDQTNDQKRCWGILQRLKIHKSSWPFRHPVDPQTQGVPDYFEKIKNPMDLKTIEKKLRGEKYSSGEEFYADVNLMLQNSFQYNAPTTKYYKLTLELEEYFKQLKTKSQLPKSAGKNLIQNDEEQSDYEVEEENAENFKKLEEKQMKERAQSDEKVSRLDNRKRTAAEYESSLNTPVANRKIAKVLITSEGPVRKDKKSQTQNQINKSNIKNNQQHKMNDQIKQVRNESAKKSAQVKEIDQKKSNKKEFKPIKIESGKKQNQNEQEYGQVSIQRQKESRFGYPQNKISLMQRQTLMYDILHIQQPAIRNQLQSFLDTNHEAFKKFKHTKVQDNVQLSGQKMQMSDKMEDQNESYELQLKDLDQESYKMLRNQVDRLMQLEKDNRKPMVGTIPVTVEQTLMKE